MGWFSKKIVAPVPAPKTIFLEESTSMGHASGRYCIRTVTEFDGGEFVNSSENYLPSFWIRLNTDGTTSYNLNPSWIKRTGWEQA